MLASEDENYLRLVGVILRRFISFLTPEREKLFIEKEFLVQLRRNILELGKSIADREKDYTIRNIVDFCNLYYKYPEFRVDNEQSLQYETDITRCCKILRRKENYSPYWAGAILRLWKFDRICQTETPLILIGTNTRFMLDELAIRS